MLIHPLECYHRRQRRRFQATLDAEMVCGCGTRFYADFAADIRPASIIP
jgi:hypothetical protein